LLEAGQNSAEVPRTGSELEAKAEHMNRYVAGWALELAEHMNHYDVGSLPADYTIRCGWNLPGASLVHLMLAPQRQQQ